MELEMNWDKYVEFASDIKNYDQELAGVSGYFNVKHIMLPALYHRNVAARDLEIRDPNRVFAALITEQIKLIDEPQKYVDADVADRLIYSYFYKFCSELKDEIPTYDESIEISCNNIRQVIIDKYIKRITNSP